MEAMRESWTDERLDYFRAETAHRFDAVDKRFDGVDKRLDRVDVELRDLNGRFDALNRTLLRIGGGIIATLLAGFAGFIATQL